MGGWGGRKSCCLGKILRLYYALLFMAVLMLMLPKMRSKAERPSLPVGGGGGGRD